MPAQSLDPYVHNPPDGIPKDRLVFGVHCYSWSGPGLYIPNFDHLGGWNKPGTRKKSLQDCIRASFLGRCLGGTQDVRNYGDMSAEDQVDWYRKHWGWLVEERIAPVWVSEFGLSLTPCGEDQCWFETLAKYVGELDADFAYWPLNGGPKPDGSSESYGLLREDWTPHVADWRRSLLTERWARPRQ